MQDSHSSTRTQEFPAQRSGNDKALRNPNPTLGDVRAPPSSQHGSDALPSTTNAANTPALAFSDSSSLVHASQAATQATTPSEFGTYGYNHSGGMIPVDWGNAVDFSDFSTYFEPVGELRDEVNNQQAHNQDFNIPQPLSNLDGTFDIQGAESTTYASTITPPPQAPSPVPITVSTSAQPGAQTRLKRKADSEPNTTVPILAVETDGKEPAAKRSAKARTNSSSQSAKPDAQPQPVRKGSISTGSKPAPTTNAPNDEPTSATSTVKPNMSDPNSGGAAKPGATGPAGRVRTIPDVNVSIGAVLPAGKVFPIQIGSELFRLSGASISSDAPSYFSHFFGEQLYSSAGRAGNIRTLYIDRDPETFRDISLHLQGYHITPRDGSHFVKLFADAQFYSLPRLTKQLFTSEIFIQIGERDFRIQRDIFSSAGDSPNYFSLGFAHFFSTPSEVFPGLDRQALLRPPSILPPSVPNRCGDTFADLVHILRGYPVNIRDEAHRADLLRDARYFHLKGVEQKLIPCDISFNLSRQAHEIVVRLEDIRQSGVSFQSHDGVTAETASKPSTPSSTLSTTAPAFAIPPLRGYVSYARPFTDETAYTLIVEVSGANENTKIDVTTMRCAFTGQTKARIASLFQVVANKLNLPATQPLGLMMAQTGGGIAAQPASPANSGLSGERVKVSIGRDAWVELDGKEIEWREKKGEEDERLLPPSKNLNLGMANGDWYVTKGQWRLKIRPSDDESGRVELVMHAVRIEAYTTERARNGKRKFLT